MSLQLSNAVSDVPKAFSGFILSIIEVREWINKILWFLKFEKTRFQSLLTGIWLRKSLNKLSDHLNIFGSHRGRSQLSPAVFRASRKLLKPLKLYICMKNSKNRGRLVFTLNQPYFWSHINLRQFDVFRPFCDSLNIWHSRIVWIIIEVCFESTFIMI